MVAHKKGHKQKDLEHCSKKRRVIIVQLSTTFLLFLVLTSTLLLFPAESFLVSARYSYPASDAEVKNNEVAFLELLAHYPQGEYSRAIGPEVRGTQLYAIIGYNPTIINMTNASNPVTVGELVYDSGHLNALGLQGNYLYVGSDDGVEVLNISNPLNITKIGEYNMTKGGIVWAIAFQENQENYAYLAAGTGGLIVLNISDPTKPEEVARYRNGLNAEDVVVQENLAFVANVNVTNSALMILDVSTPQTITEVGCYEDMSYPEMKGTSIALNGSCAYLGTDYGLFILNLSDVTAPYKIGYCYYDSEPLGSSLREEINDIFIYKNYLFATAIDSLYILDASTLSKPILIGGCKSYLAWGVHLEGTILYLADRMAGIFIFNLTFTATTNAPRLSLGQLLAIILVPPLVITLVVVLVLRWHNQKRYKQYKILHEQS